MGMILYAVVAITTIALACLVNNQPQPVTGQLHITKGYTRRQGLNTLSLLAIFTILFLLAALRLEVGNDYGTYVDTIHEIYVGGYVVTEPLFNAVVKVLCELSGGENYLLVFAVFAFVTIWIFLKALYEQTDDFPLAFFLFMTLGIYYRTFNTVRYYFVLAITLYSFRYIFRKEYGKFIMLIVLAAFFHKSVLVVIPIYLIANMTWKKWHVAVLMVGAACMVLFQDLIMKIALELYPSYKDTIYLETESGLGGNLMSIVRCVAVLVLALICYKDAWKEEKENRFYFKLNFLAILLYLCGSFLPLVGRICYYLMTSHILFIPAILGSIKNNRKKKIFTVLVIMAGVIYFLLFLKSANQPGVRVLPYKSWLFYEKEFLNAETIF
ncbi:MAG: EpsG family protein [Lachnospiraceae bacterium]|nr:EpsG family protein [Lachnospiraceae bacterium]